MKSANNSKNTNGLAASLRAYEGPSLLFTLHLSSTAAGGWLQLFDSRELPATGARPKREWPIIESTVFDHECTNGLPMMEGIVVAISSTQNKYTAYEYPSLIDVAFYVPPPHTPPKTDPTPAEPLTKPAPPPQRPPAASTPAGRSAATTKPLKGAVAALLFFLALALTPEAPAASSQTGPGPTGGTVSVRTNGVTVVSSATSINFVAGSNVFLDGSAIAGATTIQVNSSTRSNANWLYVSTDGNNATALRGRLDRPFKDPRAAVDAAIVGDTIEVFPGQYITNGLLKNGVNWIGRPGAVLAYTNQLGDTGQGIFDDRFASTAVTSSIAGFSFIYSVGTQSVDIGFAPCCGPTNVLACIVTTNPATELNLSFDRIDFLAMRYTAGPAAIFLQHGTNSYVRGNLINDIGLTATQVIGYDTDTMEDVTVQSVSTGLYWGNGDHHVEIKRIIAKYYSLYTHSEATTIPGDLHFTGDFLYGKYYSAGDLAGAEWRVWINVNEIKTDAGNSGSVGAVTLLGAGKIYIRAEKISENKGGSGTTVLLNTSGAGSPTCWLNVQKLSASQIFFDLIGGTLYTDVNQFEDLGGVATDGISLTGGTLRLKGGQPLRAIAGVGGALTNFTLLASQPSAVIAATTNVSIRAVMDYAADQYGSARGDWLWNLTITNGSGANRTVEFSQVTNAWRFAGTYGTNAPSVLTNGTALFVSGRSRLTNVQAGYTYFPWP